MWSHFLYAQTNGCIQYLKLFSLISLMLLRSVIQIWVLFRLVTSFSTFGRLR